MDCSLPDSSVLGILQARILDWVAIPFSRGLPNPGMQICLASQADSLLPESARKPQITGGMAELKPLSLPYSLALGSIYLHIKSSMVWGAPFFLCLLMNHSRVELVFLMFIFGL